MNKKVRLKSAAAAAIISLLMNAFVPGQYAFAGEQKSADTPVVGVEAVVNKAEAASSDEGKAEKEKSGNTDAENAQPKENPDAGTSQPDASKTEKDSAETRPDSSQSDAGQSDTSGKNGGEAETSKPDAGETAASQADTGVSETSQAGTEAHSDASQAVSNAQSGSSQSDSSEQTDSAAQKPDDTVQTDPAVQQSDATMQSDGTAQQSAAELGSDPENSDGNADEKADNESDEETSEKPAKEKRRNRGSDNEENEGASWAVALSYSSSSTMYKPLEGSDAYIAEQADGSYAAKIILNNHIADRAAIGTDLQTIKDHQVDWYINEGDGDHASFTIPVPSMDCSVTLYFRAGTSGNWSKNPFVYTFSSSSKKEASDVEVEFGSNVDPAVGSGGDESESGQGESDQSESGQSESGQGESDQSESGQSESGQSESGQNESETGSGAQGESENKESEKPAEETVPKTLRFEKEDGSEYRMIVVTKYTAVTDGKNINITFFSTHDTYALKIYLGTTGDISSIKSAYERAKDKSFTITVPYSMKGKRIPIVIATEKGWKDVQYYLQIPDDIKETKKPVEQAETKKNKDTEVYKPEESESYKPTVGKSTGAVDNSTGLKDGSYAPDSFSFSGGTGKLSISCSNIRVSGGRAYATLVFSSGKISYVKASGGTYQPSSQTGSSSVFEIPVQLNANNSIYACTTAMSQPHEVGYTLFVGLNAARSASSESNETEKPPVDEKSVEQKKDAQDVAGFRYIGTLKTEDARYFRLDYYEGGICLLKVFLTEEAADRNQAGGAADVLDLQISQTSNISNVSDEEEAGNAGEEKEAGETGEAGTSADEASLYSGDTLVYLLLPETAEAPAGIEDQYITIRVPAEKIYIDSNEAAVLCALADGTGRIGAIGAADEKTPEAIAAGVADGSIREIGHYDENAYREMILAGTDLAVLPSDMLEGQSTESVQDLGDGYDVLGIPMLIDRSGDEATQKGSREWISVYAQILGRGEETQKLLEEVLAA